VPARPPEFALAAAIGDPGFSPRSADVPELLCLLAAEDELSRRAERALLRLGAPAHAPAVESFRGAAPPLRGRLLRLIGRLARRDPEPTLTAVLVAGLTDADAKTRRNAIIALGKLEPARALEPLLSALDRETRVDHRRSIADALGKLGDARALERLRAAETSDPELARITREAVLKIERTQGRAAPAEIATDAGFPPITVRFHCRRGIEPILADELAALVPDSKPVSRTAAVELTTGGPLERLARVRTALRIGLVLPVQRVESAELEPAVVRALTSETATALFAALTRGALRYRLDWVDAGHRRGLTFRVAHAVAQVRPELVNDPTRAPWHVLVRSGAHGVELELVPHGLRDRRFEYRKQKPPAASHPTLAAALARIAGVADDDVVWDPFVGSGSELIERALLGRCAALYGSDSDPRALSAAGENLRAAGVRAELMLGDARRVRPPARPSLVITNPPMGRRLLSREGVDEIFRSFVAHVAESLRDGGRFVWISPLPAATLRYAREAGLVARLERDVDMGGFTAQIQVFSRSKAGRPPKR
jgi:23S rRNA G2445 N2-methylase RlmL